MKQTYITCPLCGMSIPNHIAPSLSCHVVEQIRGKYKVLCPKQRFGGKP